MNSNTPSCKPQNLPAAESGGRAEGALKSSVSMSATGCEETESPEQATLRAIKERIASLPQDAQIRIICIASTYRNVLSMDPLAELAFALVGAERAAE